jgi:rod shape-determining protein MreD
MSLFVAAVGATVAALFELTVGPYLRVGDAQPHFVLVFGVIWTMAVGLESGLVWAFVGGIALDVLAQRPLGVSSFALLVAVAGASLVATSLPRFRVLTVVPTVALLSLAYSMMLYLMLGLLRSPSPLADPAGILLPSVVYNTILAALVGPLAIAIHDRTTEEERFDW